MLRFVAGISLGYWVGRLIAPDRGDRFRQNISNRVRVALHAVGPEGAEQVTPGKLAGEEGERIIASLPFHTEHEWSWITRTVLFNRVIEEEIRGGVDTVVNLAAGLDARPYWMTLPGNLRWIEADLPGILDYKES